jgi:RNA-directed DNA polymerase
MLERVKTISDLCLYVGYPVETVEKLNPTEHYFSFEVDKPGKLEKRKIEAPKGILMDILDRLCDGLQRIYSSHKTPVAHGFIRAAVNDPDKRTIFSNASRHLNKKYLLNVDLDNFFYQITQERVRGIFMDDRFFTFNPETASFLASLVVLRGRLPMGSPTSPPLSNFATFDMDYELFRWCNSQHITFTRFVDDLSFSANFQLMPAHFDTINDMLKMHQFYPDPEKVKWYGPEDQKEVTGLIVSDKITLPEDYLTGFEKEINHLHGIRNYVKLFPDYKVFDWIRKIDRVIDGKLNFVQQVYGCEHEIYRKLNRLANEEGAGSAEMQSMSWRYAGYEYFS